MMIRKTQNVAPPEGFRYRAETLPPEDESELVEHIRQLPLQEFEFHGYTGKRRVLSFGWHRDKGVFDDVMGTIEPAR